MLYVRYRTTTVMQITEYNLLSQSTNVRLLIFFSLIHYSAQGSESCVLVRFHFDSERKIEWVLISFASLCVRVLHISRVSFCVYIYICVWYRMFFARYRERARWVSGSRLITRLRRWIFEQEATRFFLSFDWFSRNKVLNIDGRRVKEFHEEIDCLRKVNDLYVAFSGVLDEIAPLQKCRIMQATSLKLRRYE